MREIIVVFALAVLVFFLQASALGASKMPRIGFMAFNTRFSESNRVKAFRQGLRERGYVEGQNLVIEYRYADLKRERLSLFAAEMVRLQVDIIVTTGTPPTRAAQKATRSIPIVMTMVGSPVRQGFVHNLAKPGGNITGLATRLQGLTGKRLELLKEAFPHISQVAILWASTRRTNQRSYSYKEAEATARALGLKVQLLELAGAHDLGNALAAITGVRADALITIPMPGITTLRGRIVELAARSRLPAIFHRVDFVDAGGLMAYGPNYYDNFRRAAYYVDKILKGTKPADLPVEQPRKFDLVISLKTAKKLGITIPPKLLFRATKVIK